jgi:hypothetical protein
VADEMTPRSETERAIKKVREAEKAIKSAKEVCLELGEGQFDVFAADLGTFQQRIAGIAINLEQHIEAGSVG